MSSGLTKRTHLSDAEYPCAGPRKKCRFYSLRLSAFRSFKFGVPISDEAHYLPKKLHNQRSYN